MENKEKEKQEAKEQNDLEEKIQSLEESVSEIQERLASLEEQVKGEGSESDEEVEIPYKRKILGREEDGTYIFGEKVPLEKAQEEASSSEK